jgi:hypothetical protein
MAEWAGKTNLVLNEELDTLDGSGGSLGDGGRDTTHCCPMLVFVPCFRALIGADALAPSVRYLQDGAIASRSEV